MKKLVVLPLLAMGLCCAVYAQKIASGKVPAKVKSAFEKLYPLTKPAWEMEGSNYEAGFKKDGHTMSTLFESDGTLLETETDIPVSTLPAPVLAYVKEHHKGQTIKEGAKITRADGSINYEAEVNGKDVLFTADGSFIKETKD